MEKTILSLSLCRNAFATLKEGAIKLQSLKCNSANIIAGRCIAFQQTYDGNFLQYDQGVGEANDLLQEVKKYKPARPAMSPCLRIVQALTIIVSSMRKEEFAHTLHIHGKMNKIRQAFETQLNIKRRKTDMNAKPSIKRREVDGEPEGEPEVSQK